ncbi:MAG: PEGA domain-containing protein [Vicinamibacterales bacterium]
MRFSHSFQTLAAGTLGAALLLLVPSHAQAQPRGGHRGASGARVVVRAPIYYYGYGLYDPFWGGLWSPYYGWYGQYGPFGPYDGGRPRDWDGASARLQVTPKNSEVYVDGYLAGTVDDFDGALQRLNVPSGRHTLSFYRDGYQTYTENVNFNAHKTLNIKYEMSKLAAGESSGPRPEPAQRAQSDEPRPPAPPRGRPGPPPSARVPERRRDRASDFGTLVVRVQPRDAHVLIDGQEWETEGQGPLTIELADGPHDVEVRQQGYTTFRRTVQIRAGITVPLNVSLSR